LDEQGVVKRSAGLEVALQFGEEGVEGGGAFAVQRSVVGAEVRRGRWGGEGVKG